MFSPRLPFVVPKCVLPRHIHLCSVYNKNYDSRQGKMLAKLMTGSLRKKKNWYAFERDAQTPSAPFKSRGPNSQGMRRVDVLNKLFMTSITDLLSTGEVASDIVGQGISISTVKVSPDFGSVNVYWSGKGKSPEVDLEELLKQTAFKLRHELCQRHVMSMVPRIEFVADKHHDVVEEVERRLAQLALDSNYSMGDISELQSEAVLSTPLNPEIQERIKNQNMSVERPLPPMTHDVLGLDHAKIMGKLQARMQKAQALHRRDPHADSGIRIRESNASDITSTETEVSPVDFANFIKRRKIEKKKQMKQMNKFSEMELLEAESKLNEEYDDIDDGDFIEEFEQNYKDDDRYR